MFIKDYEFRYSDLDEKGNIRVTAVLDLLQDISIAHANAVGLGTERLSSQTVACLIDSWRIRINKNPEQESKITLKTGVMDTHKCEAIRKYEIWQNGECRVIATARWFIVDTENMQITRVPEGFFAAFECVDEADNNLPFVRLRPKDDLVLLGEQRVEKRDIDTNNHFNNVKSVEAALGFLPKTYELRELRVKYRREIKFGDIIKVFGRETDKGFYVEIQNENKEPCVLVCGVERKA